VKGDATAHLLRPLWGTKKGRTFEASGPADDSRVRALDVKHCCASQSAGIITQLIHAEKLLFFGYRNSLSPTAPPTYCESYDTDKLHLAARTQGAAALDFAHSDSPVEAHTRFIAFCDVWFYSAYILVPVEAVFDTFGRAGSQVTGSGALLNLRPICDLTWYSADYNRGRSSEFYVWSIEHNSSKGLAHCTEGSLLWDPCQLKLNIVPLIRRGEASTWYRARRR
jgi:hypothetical protein